MKLPNSEKAFVDIAKLRDYSLNLEHESGGHKARVFRAALGLTIDDAEWLRAQVLRIAVEGDATSGDLSAFGQKYVIDATLTVNTRSAIVRTAWIIENGTDLPRLVSCYVKNKMDSIKYLGVVALLADKPEAGLKRGDVGTVVEVLESNEHHPAGCIVEFVDETGEVLALLDVTNLSEIVPLNLKLRAA